MSSHGKCASVWMFCASCSSVPQLTSGGRMPMPRNVSAVSARIMPGTASVETTMMWPETAGIRCWKMIRASLGAGQLGGQHELLFAQREHLAAQLARQPGPADQRQHDADREIHLQRRPVRRKRRRQRHPQRNGRKRAHDLDQRAASRCRSQPP